MRKRYILRKTKVGACSIFKEILILYLSNLRHRSIVGICLILRFPKLIRELELESHPEHCCKHNQEHKVVTSY